MDKLEPEKLEWMMDLPEPRKQGTKMVTVLIWEKMQRVFGAFYLMLWTLYKNLLGYT